MIRLRVDLVVLCLQQAGLEVLLEPGEPGPPIAWRLPGQTVAERVSLEEAARTGLQRATLQDEGYLEQLFTYGDPDREPGDRTVTCAYLALVRADHLALEADPKRAWHDAAAPPALANDHGEILDYALRRLRNKLEYTAVGFELLPETFTLPELQRAYEAVLDERIDKRNFRRRILRAGVIEPTRNYRSSDGRPAQLYRYRDDAVAEVRARRLFP